MRFIKFIRWWWNTYDSFIKSAVFILLWNLLVTPFVYLYFGENPAKFVGMVVPMLLIMGFWVVNFIREEITKMWKRFNQEVPTDDVKIINRLKGTE